MYSQKYPKDLIFNALPKVGSATLHEPCSLALRANDVGRGKQNDTQNTTHRCFWGEDNLLPSSDLSTCKALTFSFVF